MFGHKTPIRVDKDDDPVSVSLSRPATMTLIFQFISTENLHRSRTKTPLVRFRLFCLKRKNEIMTKEIHTTPVVAVASSVTWRYWTQEVDDSSFSRRRIFEFSSNPPIGFDLPNKSSQGRNLTSLFYCAIAVFFSGEDLFRVRFAPWLLSRRIPTCVHMVHIRSSRFVSWRWVCIKRQETHTTRRTQEKREDYEWRSNGSRWKVMGLCSSSSSSITSTTKRQHQTMSCGVSVDRGVVVRVYAEV